MDTTPAIIKNDPYLTPYQDRITDRMNRIREATARMAGPDRELKDAALGHLYFGLHKHPDHWVIREWAPNATAIYLLGGFSNWQKQDAFAFTRQDHDVWELTLPQDALAHEDLYRLRMEWDGGDGDRIPAWATRVVQDPVTLIFNAQVWYPPAPYAWKHTWPVTTNAAPLIYEAHPGMAGEEEKISTYAEFTRNVLPRIVKAGYNTVQMMAVMAHPYYGSFGYHVGSFFAPSHLFGTPEELKELVDTAHGMGLRVIMDLVHSHAVKNRVEGLAAYDGTAYQFFHEGPRGQHVAWDSMCFNYGKPEVVHFLLSNCRYWLENFHFDGFRFDGITSMLYYDHGLARDFTEYGMYYDGGQDEDAVTYMALANTVIHQVNPQAISIAEDMSGMPGLAAPVADGGYGFDYRLSMGTPDYWIKIIKKLKDEEWNMGGMYYELTNRRPGEKSIGYAESHDQALVGDQTIIFRLLGAEMYAAMHLTANSLTVPRGLALHKMIRLITAATAGDGYLNFMGNEFGHPEWIDFPREGNNWSYAHARRQWSLAEEPSLWYRCLGFFDQDMITLLKKHAVHTTPGCEPVTVHDGDKVVAFIRAGLLFVFNFHPTASYTDYALKVARGNYRVVLDSDSPVYGGQGRVDGKLTYAATTLPHAPNDLFVRLYLPQRAALVLARTE